MTSVAVISSAVARINCLKNVVNNESEGLPKETDGLLKGLEEIKGVIVKVYDRKREATIVGVEKEVARLSYQIVDAIADARLLRRRKSGYTRQLGELQTNLSNLQAQLLQESNSKKSREGPSPGPGSSSSSEQNKQGREELLKMLREELLKEESSSPEVYLMGESGMGKTTLARRLFHDDQLRKHFNYFAWVSLTHNFKIKDVLQHLLQQLYPQLDTSKMIKIDLTRCIFEKLKEKPYLLVLEDVESMEDWESIRLALPTAESSRVIITSSNNDIISKSKGNKEKSRFHYISGLKEAEIITLLKEEAPFISDKVGKAIYEISGGSPLFATILGKSLPSTTDQNEKQLVDELLSSTPNNNRRTPRVLEASYKRLGHEVKPHLLYLGQFPAGQDVDIDKLYLLLKAENLIKEEEERKLISPQSLGTYLKELEDRKLVHVQEDHVVPKRGLYKSCRLHHQVWEFCKSKASEEEFLQIVDFGSSTPGKVGSETRRLAVHLRADSKTSAAQTISQDTLKKLWSLVIVDTFEKKSKLPSELNDLKDSSYLRILSFDGVDFGVDRKLPKGLDRLVLLKYLSFRGCRLEELPSSLTNLALLETLDLLVQDDCTMVIPSNIFANKKSMLHLYFPSKYRSGNDGKKKLKLQGMDKLETLVNFDTEVCEVGDLNRFKNLKILSTISKGNLDDALFKFLTEGSGKGLQYSSVGIKSFQCYDSSNLSKLQELLGCKSVHSVRIEGRIGKLDIMSYAETIEEIVLDGSHLQHDPMTYLCKFRKLRSLVLSNDALTGTIGSIDISAANPFQNLRSLKIHNLKYLKNLTIQNNAMPELSALQIHGCSELSSLSIPKELENRLKKAQENNGGDTFSVIPFPRNFIIVPGVFAIGSS